MDIKSDFALLDVKAGRVKLRRRLAKGERIPVHIVATITGEWGNDDGTSQEFEMTVHEIKEGL